MGGKTNGSHRGKATTVVATGIAVRQWQTSTTIRMTFQFRGVECRETLAIPATKPNLEYAKRLRAEVMNAIERGTFNYLHYFPDSKRARVFGYINANPLIKDLLHEFLKRSERTLQLSTLRGYERVTHGYLLKTFGNIPVRDLTPAFIRRWITKLPVTAKTLRNILISLRAVLQEAVNDDIIERNPLDRVVLEKLLDKKKLKSDYLPDPFDMKEIQAILKATDEPQMRNLIQFALFTGLRSSELMAIEWKDIDWINHLAFITRAKVEKQEKGTKTQAGKREVLLLPPALEALLAQKTLTFLEGKKIFHHPRTNKPWDLSNQIHYYWKFILKKAKVRYRNPYQTRHTYASMLLSSGENMLWVARQMGHRDTEMIIKTYGKWIPNADNKAGYQPTYNWGQVLSAG